MVRTFPLPAALADLLEARDRVREHYRKVLMANGSQVDLKFTLDGNLIGDIGEALSVELFGVRLVEQRSKEGIDGYGPDGRTIQVKATGTGRGPAFRLTETHADHLLFFGLNFEKATGSVLFNGPELYVTKFLPTVFAGQRSVTPRQVLAADRLVADEERLVLFPPNPRP